jgi:hypothetical protein
MAGRRGLFKQRVVRARSGWSCAATSVSTVFHYWRDSALVRGVYWTGSFASEYYRLAKKPLALDCVPGDAVVPRGQQFKCMLATVSGVLN